MPAFRRLPSLNALDAFDSVVSEHGDRVAFVDGDSAYSYRSIDQVTTAVARALRSRGVNSGTRVAAWSSNDTRMMWCALATMRAGGVWCPVTEKSTTTWTADYLRELNPGWLFFHPLLRSEADAIRTEFPSLQCASITDGFDELAESGSHCDDDIRFTRALPTRVVIPTSGSTGKPRAFEVPPHTISSGMAICHEWLHDRVESPVCLTVAPLAYSAGGQAFATLAAGGTNIIRTTFVASDVLECIEKYRVTHLFLPPTMLHFLLDAPELGRFDVSSLTSLRVGGAPVTADRLIAAVGAFGPCLCHTYGQTEAPMLTYLDPQTIASAVAGVHPERLNSCGRPSRYVQLAVADAAGDILPHGTIGEIVVSAAEADADGETPMWHRTGDIGHIDDDGFVYVVGRERDFVLVGGTNVYAAEVEAAIMCLPQIRDCAVIGVADRMLGERLVAVVSLNAGRHPSTTAVFRHCRKTLGKLKTPQAIEVWEDLPRTVSGKLDKPAVRERYAAAARRPGQTAAQ